MISFLLPLPTFSVHTSTGIYVEHLKAAFYLATAPRSLRCCYPPLVALFHPPKRTFLWEETIEERLRTAERRWSLKVGREKKGERKTGKGRYNRNGGRTDDLRLKSCITTNLRVAVKRD